MLVLSEGRLVTTLTGEELSDDAIAVIVPVCVDLKAGKAFANPLTLEAVKG